MLVSAIIAVHNRSLLLREAVESVLAQTYRPIEIVIVDDGSTDETGGTVDALAAGHPEIVALHQTNRGPGAAREMGRLHSRGEFVQYLDSDDVLLPVKFARQVEGLLRHPDCGASYGWTRLRKPDGSLDSNPVKRTGERIESMFPAFLQSRWWDTSTPLFRRSVVDAAGPWLDLRVEEDWEYDARIAALGTRLHYCETWVSETRQIDPARISMRTGAEVFRQRAFAHSEIYGHAVRAGIHPTASEMQHFARELFLLARQSGAAGLPTESERLFRLAREASGTGGNRLQFRAYAAIAHAIGWSGAGKVSCLWDDLRSG